MTIYGKGCISNYRNCSLCYVWYSVLYRMLTEMMETTVLNAAQIMILESFASAKSQEETNELMDMLRSFYAKKLDQELERLWNEGTLNQEKLDELKEQHLRTPYRPV